MNATVLWIIAAILVVVGIILLFSNWVVGVILIVLGCLVGPGGYSIFRSRDSRI